MPPAPDPDIVGALSRAGKARAWALELKDGRVEREKAWVKEGNPYPLIKAVNIKRLPTRLKTRLFPKGHADGAVGLPTPILMRIPQ